MRKLASTQRAALRTLQGYSGYGRSPEPIPPELSLVIKQLTSLSCQIGGGGAGNQLIFQLMVGVANIMMFVSDYHII